MTYSVLLTIQTDRPPNPDTITGMLAGVFPATASDPWPVPSATTADEAIDQRPASWEATQRELEATAGRW
jgi:hypothetical protein